MILSAQHTTKVFCSICYPHGTANIKLKKKAVFYFLVYIYDLFSPFIDFLDFGLWTLDFGL